MKRLIKLCFFIAVAISFSSCDIIVRATDDSIHTANFYFYNYTNQEFYSKLTPQNFRSKQKFRTQKSDYIPIKTDDEKITVPVFSFEWIPGEFEMNLTENKSVPNNAKLEFFNRQGELEVNDWSDYSGVPSAQDYSVSFYLIETFCKKVLTLEEIEGCFGKITDESDLNLFKEFYSYDYERPEYICSFFYMHRNGIKLESCVQIKNYIREIEGIVTKYDLPKMKPVIYLLSESELGEADYEFIDPEDKQYLQDDSEDDLYYY